MKYLKKIYYKNISPNFFKPSNKQTKFKIFKSIKNKIKPKDVLIITAYDKNYTKIGKLCEKSINLYCKKFKFRKKIYLIPNSFKGKYNRHNAWYKVKIIKELLQLKENKIIFWIDSDAIFSRFVDLREFLDDYHDYYLVSHNIKSKKNSGYKNIELAIPRINTGVMAFKNTEFSHKLINEVWDRKIYSNSGWWDNSAFLDVLGFKGEITNNINDHKGNVRFTKKLKLISPEWNSVPSTSTLDFSLETHNPIVFHTAGLSLVHKKSLIEEHINLKDRLKF